MSDTAFKGLDFERHARLLRGALGAPRAIAICGADGQLAWASDETPPDCVAKLVAEAQSERLPEDSGASFAMDDGSELMFRPLRCEEATGLGWLAVVVDAASKALPADSHADGAERCDVSQRERVEQALDDVASSIAREAQLHIELQGLAGELDQRHEELNLVYGLENQHRHPGENLEGARALLEHLTDYLNIDLAIFVRAEDRRSVHATKADAPIDNPDLVLTQLRGDVFRFVAVSREAFVLNEREDIRREYLLNNMPYRVLACPVMFRDRLGGMIALLRSPDEPEFSNADRNLARLVAGQAAIAMSNQELVEELRDFTDQMAGALIEAIEAKDPYTRGHSERVQSIAIRIAQAADLGANDIDDVSWGALLHDVGKIGIPDRILCKAGRLTRDEFTLVKIHPERSYEIMRHIAKLSGNAASAARHHQELYDGSGYPQGLKGTRIPVHARVISVADTYDAITSSRAYRPGRSHEVAMRIISDVAGRQLDPRFVRLFENICNEDQSWLREIVAQRDPQDG